MVLVNSGSLINLISISALTSPKLPEGKQVLLGDGVIEIFLVES